MSSTPFSPRPADDLPWAWWKVGDGWSDQIPHKLGGILSGAFNPLHEGHLKLQSIAAEVLGLPVAFELAAVNADKPALTSDEIRRRCQQFAGRPIVVSTAATFVQKSRLFVGTTFVMGADTALRIVQPRFYGGSEAAMNEALGEIAARGCKFLVAARLREQHLLRLGDLALPRSHAGLFQEIPPDRFRLDVSSTDLRRQTQVEVPDTE